MAKSEGPRPGDVWAYPYLWARQADRGESEGRKSRPTAVTILLRRAHGQAVVILLAITSQPPLPGRTVLEVPETERRRAGLIEDAPSWIVLDEHNADIVGRSYYLDPAARLGAFSARFLKEVQRAFAQAIRGRKSRQVKRADDR